jgi:hypothetical protein
MFDHLIGEKIEIHFVSGSHSVVELLDVGECDSAVWFRIAVGDHPPDIIRLSEVVCVRETQSQQK